LRQSNHKKTMRLALEASGGGAMGSFTWGVLTRLLEETCYHALSDYLRQSNHAPYEMKSARHMTLYINASDQYGREHIYTGDQLTRDKFLASAALPGMVKPVTDGDLILVDGAEQSNPNMDVTEQHRDEIDAHVLITPNHPQGLIQKRRQSDIPRHELKDTNNLVIHHVFEQAALRCYDFETGKTDKPTLIIYPEDSPLVSQKQKLSTDPIFIHDQKQQGYKIADHVISKSLSGKTPIPNLRADDIQIRANKYRTLALV